MAFINEKMPEEEKESLPFPVYARDDGAKPTLWKWTIDREREAFLVTNDVKGSAYADTEVVRHYTFSWKHHLIRLAQSKLKVLKDHRGVVLTFCLHDVEIPEELEDRQDEAMSLLTEALTVKGKYYDGQQFAAVDINMR